MSRYALILLLTSAILLSLSISGCAPGEPSGDPEVENQTETEIPMPDPVVEMDEPEALYVTGTEAEELVEIWAEFEEDVEELEFWLADGEGGVLDVQHWIIGEIGADEVVEFTYELGEAMWEVHMLGGVGLTNVNLYAYTGDEDDKMVAMDDALDNFPILHFYFEETTAINFDVVAVDVEEETDKALYCWFAAVIDL